MLKTSSPETGLPAQAALIGKTQLRLLLGSPRGFCAGVTRAIDAVRDALRKHGRPVYVRRPIVHNMEVVRALEAEGAVFVEELAEVPEGGVVLFSAHGVSPAVAGEAERRNLVFYDAVCPLVSKVHREVERHRKDGRKILLIGHAGHPEIEGTLGRISDGEAFVINSVAEVTRLPIGRNEPTAYAVQTTYSVDEARGIVEALRATFADLAGPRSSDICYATTNRQAAVREIAGRAQSVIIVGEKFSSNATRLAELAAAHCRNVQLVASTKDLDWSMVPASGTIGLSSAASTPASSVQSVIDALSARHVLCIEEIVAAKEELSFKPMEL